MNPTTPPAAPANLLQAINLRLTMLGFAPVGDPASVAWAGLAAPLLARQREESRAQAVPPCPVDGRIQAYIDRVLGPLGVVRRRPAATGGHDPAGRAPERELTFGRDQYGPRPSSACSTARCGRRASC